MRYNMVARQPDDRKRETSWFKKQAATSPSEWRFLFYNLLNSVYTESF
jgi:hypothetical protein